MSLNTETQQDDSSEYKTLAELDAEEAEFKGGD
jgi:hypothetical protein